MSEYLTIPFFLRDEVMNSGRNWPEDFKHENGNYQNRCCHCKKDFIGHKRRPFCKLCENNNDN